MAGNGHHRARIPGYQLPSGNWYWSFIMESLILAQDERWRRASYMQVERGPTCGNTGEDLAANG